MLHGLCLSYFEPPSTDQMVRRPPKILLSTGFQWGAVRVDLNAVSLQFVCHETMPYFTRQSEIGKISNRRTALNAFYSRDLCCLQGQIFGDEKSRHAHLGCHRMLHFRGTSRFSRL